MDSTYKNIYAFNVPQPSPNPQAKVSIILLGNCGVGKSVLLNNLCQSQQKVGVSQRSVTQDLFWAQCKNVSLCVVDTPGVEKNNSLTSLTLRRALRSLNWNLVVIMAKLDSRFEDNTLTQLRILSRPFNSDSNRIVYMISHLDILDNLDGNSTTKQETLAAFEETLRENKFKEPVILFSNDNSDFGELSKILYNCGSQFKPNNFTLDDKQFCRSLSFTNTIDHKQKLIADQLKNLEKKLGEKSQQKQLTKQDVRSIDQDEREAFLNQFDEAERKSVKTVVDCFLENWIVNNVIQKSEEFQRKDINEQNQNKDVVQPQTDYKPKEKQNQLQTKNNNKRKYNYTDQLDINYCRYSYLLYLSRSRSRRSINSRSRSRSIKSIRQIYTQSIYENNTSMIANKYREISIRRQLFLRQLQLAQIQRRKEQRDYKILRDYDRQISMIQAERYQWNAFAQSYYYGRNAFAQSYYYGRKSFYSYI